MDMWTMRIPAMQCYNPEILRRMSYRPAATHFGTSSTRQYSFMSRFVTVMDANVSECSFFSEVTRTHRDAWSRIVEIVEHLSVKRMKAISELGLRKLGRRRRTCFATAKTAWGWPTTQPTRISPYETASPPCSSDGLQGCSSTSPQS